MKKIIKIHALMLLNLYGVKEKNVKDSPRALNTFVDLLKDGITEKMHNRKELLNNLIPARADKINSSFSNRNLEYIDGYNNCRQELKNKIDKIISHSF